MDSPARGRSRTTFIVGLLLATLVLAIVLGVQAGAAASYHRATAEGVLRDYAQTAAEEYARRVARELEYYGVYPTMGVLRRANAGLPGTRLLDLHETTLEDGLERQAAAYVRSAFRVDLADGTVRAVGAELDPPLREWLADTLRAAAAAYDTGWNSAIVVDPSPGQAMFAYALGYDAAGRPLAAFGIMLDGDSARAIVGRAAARGPLLPATLTRRARSDTLVAARLVDGIGRVIHRSAVDGPAYAPYRATATLGPRAGGLAAEVSLHPDAAAQLIIGGLPRGRLPLIGGLLALTTGLILAAVMLLRRESELQRLRTEFVSNVSHELRTPLAEIRMFAETLALGRVRTDTERQRSLEIIDQEARRLTHLVENVLYLSRSDRNARRISPEPTPLAPVIEHVTEVFQPLAAARAVTVKTGIDASHAAIADRGAVQQMVLNLLDNAVKYGPQGQTVSVGSYVTNGVVRLWVDDEGPGVPKAERDRIWRRFSRLDRERDAAVAGTGIGLAVVRELAEMQHGRAWWEAAPSGGSRFLIELPAAVP